jgi:hypothetical protein
MARRLPLDSPDSAELYRTDFHSWCLRQAELARAGRLDALDLPDIAEELAALGVEQEHALEASLRVLLLHLLKWRHQARRRSRSWRATIVRERLNYAKRLKRNPGLKPKLPELFADAYADARKEAAAETGLAIETFPAQPSFRLEEAVDEAFWPAAEPLIGDPPEPRRSRKHAS